MRISYSCTANLERLIKSNNQKMLNKNNLIQNQGNCAGGCNYNFKGGGCRLENIIYKAIVNSNLEKSSTSAYAQLGLDFDMLNIKII